MAEIETIGILDELQTLVSDRLQVVSYKWLSRNFLVSSNVAKKLLQEFVKKYGAGLEVIYSLSGWLKNNPSTYHIKLVPHSKLAEAKEEFDNNCSLQVYSVQACLPKDPTVLWNAEYVQAEELFKQPPEVDNCLRDNRFCGVSNSFVKRNTGGNDASTSTSQVKSTRVLGQSKSTSAQKSPSILQPVQKKVQQSSPSISLRADVVKDVKNDNRSTETHEQNKPSEVKGKVPQFPVNKKKGPNDKNSSGTGSSLANMWGRASAKPKSEPATAKANDSLPNSAASADALICAIEELGDDNSDDDITIRRAPNREGSRKRRVVFDYSDEEDDLKEPITLASPDPPKMEPVLGSKQSSASLDLEKNKLSFDEEKEQGPNVKERKEAETKTNQALKEESSTLSKPTNMKTSSSERNVSNVSAVGTNVKDKTTDAAPKSPKRRKVLKTRIDERGREVTEVVWEGKEAEKKPDCQAVKKVDEKTTANAFNRPSVKKSPAVGTNAPVNQAGKAGNKKAVNKDPKQGNILSFFKKV